MKQFMEEGYRALIDGILAEEAAGDVDAGDDAKTIIGCFDTFFTYVEHVTNMENRIKVAKFRMEPADYRTFVEELDRTRRRYHDASIISVRMLNRVARFYRAPLVFQGDEEDRWQIADFCSEAVQFLSDVTSRLGQAKCA